MAHVASGAHTDAKTPPNPTFPKEWMRLSCQYGVLVLSSSSNAAAFNLCVARPLVGACAAWPALRVFSWSAALPSALLFTRGVVGRKALPVDNNRTSDGRRMMAYEMSEWQSETSSADY